MNQWIAWCWGTFLCPPLTEAGVKAWEGLGYADFYTRRHRSFGLLLGRVFIGITVSRPLSGAVTA